MDLLLQQNNNTWNKWPDREEKEFVLIMRSTAKIEKKYMEIWNFCNFLIKICVAVAFLCTQSDVLFLFSYVLH